MPTLHRERERGSYHIIQSSLLLLPLLDLHNEAPLCGPSICGEKFETHPLLKESAHKYATQAGKEVPANTGI